MYNTEHITLSKSSFWNWQFRYVNQELVEVSLQWSKPTRFVTVVLQWRHIPCVYNTSYIANFCFYLQRTFPEQDFGSCCPSLVWPPLEGIWMPASSGVKMFILNSKWFLSTSNILSSLGYPCWLCRCLHVWHVSELLWWSVEISSIETMELDRWFSLP